MNPAEQRSTAAGRAAQGIAEALRTETIGGALLLLGAVLALAWANSPWGDTYRELLATSFGPESLHLDLEVRVWAADGLLAIFFFVAGVELKQEFVAGELRDPKRAMLPVVAAFCGVAVPALIYLAVAAGEPGAVRGWAIPTATDIAFALAVLAVIGRHLPTSVRSFLLTLAVVDDLIAITIIAFFYTSDLEPLPLLGALLALAAFGWLARRRPAGGRGSGPVGLLLILLALLTWGLVHASGVHATVAGVLLAFAMPISRDESEALGDRVEHLLRPLSAGVAVPVFAFCSAGVAITGSVTGAFSDPVVLGIVAGLVLGKPVGIITSTLLLARLTRTDPGMTRADLLGAGLLAGVGFTVSLLIGELAFGPGSARDDDVRLAVLAASALASGLAALVLVRRNSVYRGRLASSG